MHETLISRSVEDNANMLVPFYLMCSYAYYVEDKPLVSDAYYDDLAKHLLREYDRIHHRHISCISKDMLRAGTFLGKYPSIVEGAVNDFRQ